MKEVEQNLQFETEADQTRFVNIFVMNGSVYTLNQYTILFNWQKFESDYFPSVGLAFAHVHKDVFMCYITLVKVKKLLLLL